MSQLNLKKILSGDNVSTLVDIINYNFDQIVLNGGGPQGLRGIIGAPGLPGLQGIVGDTGPTGIDGTYIYSAATNPNDYIFGATGENFPRINDIFLEIQPMQIIIWQNETGPSAHWMITGTVSGPGSGNRIMYDNDYHTGEVEKASFVNDASVAGKAFFGTPESFDPSNGIVINSNQFSGAYSSGLDNFRSPNTVTIAGINNQLRILSSDHLLDLSDGTNFIRYGGGVVHSVEREDVSGDLWYRIVNGDSDGNKNLHINISKNIGSEFLIGTTANRMIIGGQLSQNVTARLSVNKSLIVGDGIYYTNAPVFDNSMGIISQGNLIVGQYNDNSLCTAAFYSRTTAGTARVHIGTQPSSGFAASKSELTFGLNIPPSGTPPSNNNLFRITLSGNQNIASVNNSLRITQSISTGGNISEIQYMRFAALGDDSIADGRKSTIGVGNDDPVSMFEIGDLVKNRISIGSVPGNSTCKYISNYLGFNIGRFRGTDTVNPEGIWYNRGSSTYGGGNSFSTIWTNTQGLFNIAIDKSVDDNFRLINDETLFNATHLSLGIKDVSPILVLSENNSAVLADSITNAGLMIDISATGDLTLTEGRRVVAVFGGVLSGSHQFGSPAIFDTNGITQHSVSVKPQYSFYNNDLHGLYLSQGTNVNGFLDTYKNIGLCVGGKSGVHVAETLDVIRVGIGTRNPYEKFQIGNRLVVHDSQENKFFGYNCYYDENALNPGLYPIEVSPESEIIDTSYNSGSAIWKLGSNDYTTLQTQKGFKNYGGFHSLEVFDAVSALGTQLENNNTTTKSCIKVISGGKGMSDGNFTWTKDNYTPKVLIGFESEYDVDTNTASLLRRGTLAIVNQLTKRFDPSIENDVYCDYYGIGLYSHDASPVAGIRANNTGTQRQFEIKLLSDRGSNRQCITDNDVTALSIYSKTPNISDVIPHTDRERQVQLGSGFRLGIGKTLTTTPTDSASLEVGVTGGAQLAAAITGDVKIVGDTEIAGELKANTTDIMGDVYSIVSPIYGVIPPSSNDIIAPADTDRIIYLMVRRDVNMTGSFHIHTGFDTTLYELFYGIFTNGIVPIPITVIQKKGWFIKITNPSSSNTLIYNSNCQNFGIL